MLKQRLPWDEALFRELAQYMTLLDRPGTAQQELLKSIASEGFEATVSYTEQLSGSTWAFGMHVHALFLSLASMLKEVNTGDSRRTRVHALVCLIEYALHAMKDTDPRTNEAQHTNSPELFKTLTDALWHFRLVESRMSGEAPTLGGIRLIREAPLLNETPK